MAEYGIEYNDAREYLGLPRVKSFEEITQNKAVQGMLKHLYGSVDKIEAYVGCFSEDQFVPSIPTS